MQGFWKKKLISQTDGQRDAACIQLRETLGREEKGNSRASYIYSAEHLQSKEGTIHCKCVLSETIHILIQMTSYLWSKIPAPDEQFPDSNPKVKP